MISIERIILKCSRNLTPPVGTARMTFAEYMDQVLYGPEGYYASARARSGRQGDYFTAPDVGPAFGELMAAFFQSWQTKLDISPFHLIEAGAGMGGLAQVLRPVWPGPYTAIER